LLQLLLGDEEMEEVEDDDDKEEEVGEVCRPAVLARKPCNSVSWQSLGKRDSPSGDATGDPKLPELDRLGS